MQHRHSVAPAHHHCQCANHLLLSPGSECELCMGWVPDSRPGEAAAPSGRAQYDMAYFEALEQRYSDFEFAA